MKVLIVDDYKLVRDIINTVIRNKSIRLPGEFEIEVVGEADDGKIALTLFKNARPDVVTLDLSLRNMDGLTTMTEMLKMNPSARIIVISGTGDAQTMAKAMEMGAYHYITKPFRSKQLIAVMEKIAGEMHEEE